MEKKNIHENHRARMKKKFTDAGSLEFFESHEQLEMLLYYACPRRDTNGLAHRLLDTFGSFSAICDASISTLVESGISEHVAILLKMIPEFARIYINDKHNNTDKIVNFETLGEIFLPKYIGKENEEVYLLLLDSKGKELYCGCVSKGSFTSSEVPVRKIVELCVKYNAYTATIAHNHPSGVACPTRDDIEVTINLKKTLEIIGCMLIDHIIIADNDYVSLAQSEMTKSIFFSEDE